MVSFNGFRWYLTPVQLMPYWVSCWTVMRELSWGRPFPNWKSSPKEWGQRYAKLIVQHTIGYGRLDFWMSTSMQRKSWIVFFFSSEWYIYPFPLRYWYKKKFLLGLLFTKFCSENCCTHKVISLENWSKLSDKMSFRFLGQRCSHRKHASISFSTQQPRKVRIIKLYPTL